MSDHTRRSWMITISHTAVALGVVGEVQGAINDAPLPPGVYLPSRDHLSHALMSAERFHPIPPGCPTDYVRPANSPFVPLFFSPDDFQVIMRFAQILLGDKPENAEVGQETGQEVAEWIDLHVSSASGLHDAEMHLDPLYRALAIAYFGQAQLDRAKTGNAAKTCREGLTWIASVAHSQHSENFLALGLEKQIALLDSISDERKDKERENAGTRLFTFLKTETIRAFYTSRAGLKELDFKGNAFYARSPGCDSK